MIEQVAWQEINGNWVLVPSYPQGIIHFLGGAFIGALPHITYRSLLENLGAQGYVVITTPFINTFAHADIACTVQMNFESTLKQVASTAFFDRTLPIYGMAHSMGTKIQLLIGSLFPIERTGNIFLAFNNYSAEQSVPFLNRIMAQVPPTIEVDVEFKPSPTQTMNLAARNYSVDKNLLIQFRIDDMDETSTLAAILKQRFPDSILTTVKQLPGDHLTPLAQNFSWQIGQQFSPVDAIVQWVQQQTTWEFQSLNQEILHWLNS